MISSQISLKSELNTRNWFVSSSRFRWMMPPVILCNDFTVLLSKYSHDTWKSLNVVTKLQFEKFFSVFDQHHDTVSYEGSQLQERRLMTSAEGHRHELSFLSECMHWLHICACLFFVSAHGWHAVFTCAVSYSLLHWFTERWFHFSFSNLPVEFTSRSRIKVKNRRIFFFP